MIRKGTYLVCGWESGKLPDGTTHMDAAKEYIKRYGYTQDDVKLIRRYEPESKEHAIYVIAKRDWP